MDSVYVISTSVTEARNASPASRRPASTSGSSSASCASNWACAVSREASFWAAVTASSRRGCGGSPERTRSRWPVNDHRSRDQRSSARAPSGSSRSRSSPRHTASQVGSITRASSERISRSAPLSSASRASAASPSSADANAVRARSYRSIAGASRRLSKSGSVAGPAGGQSNWPSPSRASSARSAASAPEEPAGGSIQASSAPRCWSSRLLCPVAQCRFSRSVAASSSEEPGTRARSP